MFTEEEYESLPPALQRKVSTNYVFVALSIAQSQSLDPRTSPRGYRDIVIYPGIHTGNEPRLFLYVPLFVKSLSLFVPAFSPEHRRHWQIMTRWWTTLSLHGYPFGRVAHRLTGHSSHIASSPECKRDLITP